MITLMESVLCGDPGTLMVRATSSAPPWATSTSAQGDTTVTPSSPDGVQSDAASTSSYVISSSNLMDSRMALDTETRDSSPQSTSFDGYDQQQYLLKKNNINKPHRDPTSHRIIEKRRRDRMNNCLTNLSKLIPSAYLKKGRGRIEKTEIIEMAIRYMKHIELERRQLKREQTELQEELMLDKGVGTEEDVGTLINVSAALQPPNQQSSRTHVERYKQGFFDCIAETLRFLAGAEGLTVNDQMKTRLLFHLREYFGRISDYACTQPNPNLPKSTVPASNGHEKEDTEEPLNMSLKRSRPSPVAPSRYTPSNLEMPSSCSVGSSGCGGSQLRDILETKEPLMGEFGPSKSESSQQHLPHSTMPTIFMQQKFSSAQQLLEQKAGSQNGSDRSLSSLLTGSLGPRSTCSSSNAATTSQYPSSPGSSVNSLAMESPPGLHSPPLPMPSSHRSVPVPIFALHPVGLFYVPLTVDSHLLDSAFNASIMIASENGPGSSAVHQMALQSVTHPITINVNFNFLPSMANVLANVHQQARNTTRPAGSPSYPPRQSNGLFNTAYAPSLRLALKH